MDNKCYRCDKKTQCSHRYPAQSTNPVSEKAQKFLKINTSNAKEEVIQCCVGCISPKSRINPLHTNQVFVRPENMFLNYIVAKIDEKIDVYKTYNEVEVTSNKPVKKDKYDMLLKSKDKFMLVEIDESQHFEKKQFHEDRKREKRFKEKYGTSNPILRIRIGDDTTKIEKMNACIKRDGEGCSIVNKIKFDNNMVHVIKHIVNHFKNKDVIKHAYIEFFTDDGVLDFKKVFNHQPSNKKFESLYEFVKYPVKHEPAKTIKDISTCSKTSDSGKYKGYKCTKADNHEGRHTYVI